MPTPNPEDMISTATEILIWPMIAMLGALSVGLFDVSAIPRMLRSVLGSDDPMPAATTEPFAMDYLNDLDDEEEPADLYGTMPVECHRCNGVTDVASSGGRCKYCGTPLTGFGASGWE